MSAPAVGMLDWLDGHLFRFDPASGEAPTERPFIIGPLIELLMVGRALEQDGAELAAHVRRWHDLARNVLDRPTVREQMLAEPAQLPFYCALAALSGHPRALALTRQLVLENFGEHELDARHPNARLEFRWASSLCDAATESAVHDPGLISRTTCANLPALGYLTENDVYAFTHCVFYLTDFGRWSFPQADLVPTLAVQTRYLLAWALLHRQLDLVAELLMCLRYLPTPASAVEAFARGKLLASRVGATVPGPFYRADVASTMPDERRAGIYLFRTSFHTTLVSAAALSAPGADQSAGVPEELGVVRTLLLAGKGKLPAPELTLPLHDPWLARSVRAARSCAELRARTGAASVRAVR